MMARLSRVRIRANAMTGQITMRMGYTIAQIPTAIELLTARTSMVTTTTTTTMTTTTMMMMPILLLLLLL